jgi:hypothetical protein
MKGLVMCSFYGFEVLHFCSGISVIGVEQIAA